jgi:hypothetical protein
MMPDDGAISVRAAREDDLPWLTELENRPENAAFVHQWTHDTHADWISRRGIRYLIAELDGHRAGYAILNGVSGSDASIELARPKSLPACRFRGDGTS